MEIVIAVGAYLGLGIIAIILLDLFTGRVRKRLKLASYETQEKLVLSGSFVGVKVAMFLTVFALWLFWPVAIYGALSSLKGEKTDGQKG